MKDIYHIADIVDTKRYYQQILDHTPWVFEGSSGHPEETFKHWCFYPCDKDGHIFDVTSSIWEEIVDIIYADTGLSLEPHRRIINAYNHGDTSYGHIDGHTWTVIAYMNPEWDMNWGGYTVLFDDNQEEIYKCVYPRPGSVLVFPGRIMHRPTAVERNAPCPRIGLTFQCEVDNA